MCNGLQSQFQRRPKGDQGVAGLLSASRDGAADSMPFAVQESTHCHQICHVARIVAPYLGWCSTVVAGSEQPKVVSVKTGVEWGGWWEHIDVRVT